MSEGGVYSITCVPSGKIYVGSTVNFRKRWREYGLETANMWKVVKGIHRQHNGWFLLNPTKEWEMPGEVLAKPYPPFIHEATGEIIPEDRNLSRLCRERGLHQGHMCDVANSKSKSHKGWALKPTAIQTRLFDDSSFIQRGVTQ